MSSARAGRTVVVGLGNPILTDDRAGLAVAEEVRRLLSERPLPDVDVAFGTRGGFEWIDLLSGYRRAILVDCIAAPDCVPGRVSQLELSRISGSTRLAGAHEVSLGGAFALAKQLGIAMPADVTVFGVEGGEVEAFSEEMTPRVSAAVPVLAARIYESLRPAAAAAPRPADGGDRSKAARK